MHVCLPLHVQFLFRLVVPGGGVQREGEATDCNEGEFTDSLIDSVASESDDHWESESETSDDDSVYVPTPDRLRLGKASPIDLPNKLCFITWASFNNVRHCSTPGCKGNLV